MYDEDIFFSDLRVADKYLTESEREQWKEQNILYNTLYFWCHYDGPDIEFSDSAIQIYKNNVHYENWGEIYHLKGKVLVAPKNNIISADLMTGWWNPFKKIVGLNESTSRKELIEELLAEIENRGMKSKEKEQDVIQWLVNKGTCSEETYKYFFKFLKVVYTSGNIVPSAVSYRSGRGLDGWDTKLINISKSLQKEYEGYLKVWGNYIRRNFDNSWKTFIEKNKLQMYFHEDDSEFENPLSFWGEETVSIGRAKDENWKRYFENAYSRILRRSKELRNSDA